MHGAHANMVWGLEGTTQVGSRVVAPSALIILRNQACCGKNVPRKNVPPDLRKEAACSLHRSTAAEYSKADEDVDRNESVLKGERWRRVSRAYRIPLSEYWFIFALHDMNDVHTVNPLADAQMYWSFQTADCFSLSVTIKRKCIICTPLEDDQQSVKERGKRKDVIINDTLVEGRRLWERQCFPPKEHKPRVHDIHTHCVCFLCRLVMLYSDGPLISFGP